MDTSLRLVEEPLDENQLIFKLKEAFDKGHTIDEVEVNSQTALNLHQSPARVGELYDGPFGTVRISVISKQDINQMSIDDGDSTV